MRNLRLKALQRVPYVLRGLEAAPVAFTRQLINSSHKLTQGRVPLPSGEALPLESEHHQLHVLGAHILKQALRRIE
jgi:hypothetical protein